MYCSSDNMVVGSVIWLPNKSGVGYLLETGHPSREMVDWFNKTDAKKIQRIASKMAYDEIRQKQK